jgi:hypothetical protein
MGHSLRESLPPRKRAGIGGAARGPARAAGPSVIGDEYVLKQVPGRPSWAAVVTWPACRSGRWRDLRRTFVELFHPTHRTWGVNRFVSGSSSPNASGPYWTVIRSPVVSVKRTYSPRRLLERKIIALRQRIAPGPVT